VAGNDGQKPDANALKAGLSALEDVDLFNILCIPRAADLDDTSMTSFVSDALKYCEERRAFMVIDIPRSINTVEEVKDWLDVHNGFRHKNAALYFPRLMMPDPLNEYRLRSVGASGTVAGLYARIDSTRGVWKAPAGTEASLRGIGGLETKLTDPQNGTLNPLAINCLRNFPIYGDVAWGGRTLVGSDQAGSEWKYVPIRRLALFLEESLYRGTKWVVFEPNDEPLWAQIRLNLNAFMMGLFRQGAFQGSTPDKAFYVKCDGETTTQADRNLGIVNIEVGFAPLKPAEFVVIKIQQIAGEL
jgi:phage tail sheath protein FI